MIAEVKGAPVLQGFRGRLAADLEAPPEGHLAELGINPLMVLPSGQGGKTIDALVVRSRRKD